jgi:nickel superoxide dismutase
MRFIKPVYAHCDVPCGIYETDSASHAAATCLRMVEKINALGELDTADKHAQFVRMVTTKEKHAQKVKNELYVLWSDYFKPEHLEKFPELHATFWQAIKQASEVKHVVSIDACNTLIERVQTVSDIFAQSKQ